MGSGDGDKCILKVKPPEAADRSVAGSKRKNKGQVGEELGVTIGNSCDRQVPAGCRAGPGQEASPGPGLVVYRWRN